MKDELLEQYKAMAKHGTMEERIDAHLKANCEKYDPKKLKDCVKHLVDVARKILDGKNGEVPDEVCFKICRDYFNDEMWAKEDEEKAAKEEKRMELAEKKKAPKKAAKKTEPKAKKVTQDFEKEQLDKERERLEKLKEKHGLKAAEPPKKVPEAKKFPTCRVCGREVINVYKEGMCLDCYYKRPMQAEKTPAQTAQIQPEQGQLDLFAAMGV